MKRLRGQRAVHVRPFQWGDVPHLVRVINSGRRENHLQLTNEAEIRGLLNHYFDAQHDCFVAEDSAGHVIGVATMRRLPVRGKGQLTYDVDCDYDHFAVGSALITAAEERLRQQWPDLPPDARYHILATAEAPQVSKAALLAASSYQRDDTTTEWRLDLSATTLPAATSSPEVVQVRPFDESAEVQAVFALDMDLFNLTPSADYDEWRREVHLEDTWFDPTLWQVAETEGGIIGLAVVYVALDRDRPDLGAIDRIGVRPGWRRRGIATALMQAGLRRLKAAGAREVMTRTTEQWPPLDAASWLRACGWRSHLTRHTFCKMMNV